MSPDLLGVLGPDGVFETSNPAWSPMLGWNADEVSATTIFDLVHPDDAEGARRAFEQALAGAADLSVECRCRHRDGSYRWIAWLGAPEAGKAFCSGRDVTSEKVQAVQLLQAQDRVRQAQKAEAIGQLTGGVAHDFNNLLTIIRSSVDFLRRGDLPEARRSRYVEAISDTVTRATTLTAQLLAFARRQPLKPSTFEVATQVRSVVDMIRPLMGSRIDVACEFETGGSYVCVDISQFETALINLAVNARDAMNGEGRLTFAVQDVTVLPEVRGHLSADGAFVAISISDSGAGIAPDVIASIFDPFFTTKGVGKGTGLGLSQVFGFAKQSGGEIDVASEEGRGTTFTLYLPRAVPHGTAALSGDSPTSAEPSAPGLSVLLVEDNEAVGAFTKEMLSEMGHMPQWVGSAGAALALLATNDLAFDVVFSDVMMPGMTGLEMAKLIRMRHPGLPVILTSGYSEVIAREGQDGFDLLQKPYSVDALARRLRLAVAGNGIRRG